MHIRFSLYVMVIFNDSILPQRSYTLVNQYMARCYSFLFAVSFHGIRPEIWSRGVGNIARRVSTDR